MYVMMTSVNNINREIEELSKAPAWLDSDGKLQISNHFTMDEKKAIVEAIKNAHDITHSRYIISRIEKRNKLIEQIHILSGVHAATHNHIY